MGERLNEGKNLGESRGMPDDLLMNGSAVSVFYDPFGNSNFLVIALPS